MFLQSGKSSSKALLSKQLPLKIWAPISDPFSNKHTLISLVYFYYSNYFNLIAVANPAGPPPTMTTSYSITSISDSADEEQFLKLFLNKVANYMLFYFFIRFF